MDFGTRSTTTGLYSQMHVYLIVILAGELAILVLFNEYLPCFSIT